MENEKPFAQTKGLNIQDGDQVTMTNHKANQFQFQAESRRDLLEQSKLSRLPERKSFNLPNLSFQEMPSAVSVCVGCGGRLDGDDTFQQSVKGCRKCLGIYARLNVAFDESAKRKRREHLEKFAAEVKW